MSAVIQIERKEVSFGAILGKMYLRRSFGQANLIGHTLERLWNDNAKNDSCIPLGRYPAFVRTDGPRGWRLELRNVPGNRTNVQIHRGNFPKDSIGCILPGLQAGLGRVYKSADAMDLLKKALEPELRALFPEIQVEITDPGRTVDYYPTCH